MPDPFLPGRLGLYASMVHYGLAHNRDFAHEHHAFFRRMLEEIGEVRGRRILDIGCGRSAWLSLLLHSLGARVTGVDVQVTRPGVSLAKYRDILRENGLETAARTLAWDLLFAAPYYRELQRVCEFPLRFDGLDLRPMSAHALELPDASFDLAVSHEVFEHLPDVAGAVRELARVLRPEGRTYLYIHNYTSLSGGHHIAWKYPDSEPSRVVPPWDHLRERRHPHIPSWINRWREHQYREAFATCFEVIEWRHTAREGEALLTPQLQAELAGYEREELLAKGLLVVARPRTQAKGKTS
jgi:SAM-dependent methyltransferase